MRAVPTRRIRRGLVALTSAVTLSALAACVGSVSARAPVDCSPYRKYGDLRGRIISVYSSIVGPEAGSQKDSYGEFGFCTGATITYEGSKDFEARLPVRIKDGNPPDIAFVQPGQLQALVRTGKVVRAPQAVSDNTDTYFTRGWKAYGTVDGAFYAAPLGTTVKSLVWYSPKVFTAKGYAVPQTWDELMALSTRIARDDAKGKPWCAGFGSGGATGWVGTDWLEDLMLRTAGPETYDRWVAHQIPFDDRAVATALAKVGSILKNDKFVNGGLGDVRSIATTTFDEAGLPILDGSCYLHRQASFYAANWPKGTKVAEDGDVWAFYLPTVDPSAGKPVLGVGELAAAFASRPEVEAFQAYLSSPEWANNKAKATPGGGWVSANKELKPKNLASPVDRLSAQILQDPKAVFRFDASDQMPAAVGAGTFWREMTSWVATGKSDKDVLDAIEQSWPRS